MKNRIIVPKNQRERGQALITMIFFIVIAVSILSVSALILTSSMQATTSSEQGLLSYSAAESGAEDGILHVLRSDFTGPSTSYSYSVDTAQVSVSISEAGNVSTITSTAVMWASSRTIEVKTSREDGKLKITSWKEI